MASTEDINAAIGCLSTVFPQYVARELATLTDNIATAIQGFVDPLQAIGDIQVDSLISDVKDISKGDIFDNLGSAAVGLTAQYVRRELDDVITDASSEYLSPSKKVHKLRNLSNEIVSTAYSAMSLYNDFPYAAAQKMCETIIELTELKISNLQCLEKHIVQLVNSVLVVIENSNYKDDTLVDLSLAKDQIVLASIEVGKSETVINGVTAFDQNAFTRGREALVAAKRLLTPDKDGTSILDAVDILTVGSAETGQLNRANQSLVHIVIPSLRNLVQQEAVAMAAQVEVINFYVFQLSEIIASYQKAGTSSRVKTERSRAIQSIKSKLTSICARMELAIDRDDITVASVEMLSWSSRVKSLIATMDKVNALTLQVGSIEGEGKAAVLEASFQELLVNLASINKTLTVNGIEDPLPFRDKVISLTKYAEKVVSDVNDGKVSESTLATFHRLATQTAEAQVSLADESISVALQQKVFCEEFAAIELKVRENFDGILDTMRQVGMDRGVDMLTTGQFAEFLETDLDSLSYLGAGANCLADALKGIDDTQTRQQISSIRDDMVAQKTNQDLAASDSADNGRKKYIAKIKTGIATIQRNAKTVESIVVTLEGILKKAKGTLDQPLGEITTFLGNLDHLNVNAGGRLADKLEEYSDHPNEGVPLCVSV